MQRYHAGSCTSAVNNGAITGIQSRDTSFRADPPPNFTLNARRSAQPTQYNLRCDKEQLNSRLGPPDFRPQAPNCPEETLNREYAQCGYRETVEGLEEAREVSLSQVQAFTKPITVKCREAIRKCHRAINESRAQKRKAGQVYGVPLSGTLLAKPGVFPEQRPCGEDFRKKWIEGLSQPHKRLRSLTDHVPHGYKKKSLFEGLIRNNVPMLRATWFIKVTYLNLIRRTSSNSLAGYHDKNQFARSEQWTKDVIDYLQGLLDEFVARNNTHPTSHSRDRSSQIVFAGSVQRKGDSYSAVINGAEPSLYVKWWYVVRIIQWHNAEGLIVPSLIIDWVLNQLQEKELLSVMQLLLPIIYGVIESVVSSQIYVSTLASITFRFIREPSPGGSDLVDNSRRAYTTAAIIEMLRYIILAVPDTFVALDSFPLPISVMSHFVSDGNFLSKIGKVKYGQTKFQAESFTFQSLVSSIQRRSETLSRAARPNRPGHNVAKALQVLDQALMHGDIGISYDLLLENTWVGVCAERWSAEVSPCLHISLKHVSKVTSMLLCSLFFICEWATCEFRDFRTSPPHGLKFTGRKDFSEIFIAIRLLKMKMNSNRKNRDISDIFESPGPLHDVIVCWIDQHEVHNKEGFVRLQLLIRELIKSSIFNPLAYVRQLIISGIMDGNGTTVDSEKRKRHYKLLKHLPAPYVLVSLEEAKVAEKPMLLEAMLVYSNERRMALHGLSGHAKSSNNMAKKRKYQAMSKLPTEDDNENIELEELKASISLILHLPDPSALVGSGVGESQGNSKKPDGPHSRTDDSEETSGCEECRKVKRQKMSEETGSLVQLSPLDDEEIWWIRKGMKFMESFKPEPPPKPAKQTSRGRQKPVRKTQSLAQLAAARIESSQGSSTSHMCESRCLHHKTVSDDVTKSVDGIKKQSSGDIGSIRKLLKRMRFVDKRTLSVWLISVVKQFIVEAENTAPKVGKYGRSFSGGDDRGSVQWRLSEDELLTILYILDVCDEFVSAVRFLLWLLLKVPNNPGPVVPSRNVMMHPKIAEKNACNVGEAFLLSLIRSYENIIVAADLIPDVLSATVRRAATFVASKGWLSLSPALVYARYLRKKYSNVSSVVEWEKIFKSTSDNNKQISEIDSGKSLEGDIGFNLGAPNGVEDLDDYFRQKINGVRVSRVGSSMKEIVQRHVDEAFQYFYSKDRKPYGPGTTKSPITEKLDDGYQIAHHIVMGLLDCMRQTGGAAQEGDPSLVSSAIAAIFNNVGHVTARIPDFPTSGINNQSKASSSPSRSLHFARRILRIHVTCLCLLKEALGERQSRVFEVALSTEASLALVQALTHGKSNSSNETLNNTNKAKAARITSAISALVIGSILQGVASLERMVTLFKLKEGLDLIQFVRSLKSNANGNARSSGILKVDNLIEVSMNWFRVLVGNCRTVCDGFIVDLLGEPSIVALFRMQRMLSLNLVFPPAYSICAFVIWKPILDSTVRIRDDFNQSLAAAMSDTIKHFPFRETCLRDTRGLYDLIAADTLDSDFISMLQSFGSDSNLKAAALVPLRSRLFLDALVDCKIPEPVITHSVLRKRCGENVKKLLSKLVHGLDTLQPAKFHWQWVELRLLLNEQAVNEKIMENYDISLTDAIKSLTANPDKSTASENESNFIQIILTRLLVRPDAAPLFSEIVRLLGKSLEDSMLSQAKWLLCGTEVLYGKKSIRQKFMNIATELKDLSLKPQYWKPWGWCNVNTKAVNKNGVKKRKFEGGPVEEGEVVDEGIDFNGRLDVEGFIVSQQHLTERALLELILPCVDQGSDDLRSNFASELIKQMSNIEQHINGVTRGVFKPASNTGSAIGSPVHGKNGGRKSGKNVSSGISRQSAVSADSVPPSPAALRASMTLRLQFLLKLLPIICADREPSSRSMRHTLASVVLRLLGSRVIHENACHFAKESLMDTSNPASFLCGESVFDCLLLLLHVLLRGNRPSWLKTNFESKSAEIGKDYAPFDREVAESLQNDLDRMELPETIRWRIQTAMPIILPSAWGPLSCEPQTVPPIAVARLQPSNPVTSLNPTHLKNPARGPAALKTKPPTPQHEFGTETDRWTILEDGAGSGQLLPGSANVTGGDQANLKASSWLKGAVRVRRTELTYIGAVDEDC
ncbi:hypothetical protein CASFOL_033528 [Castilleja foliolosa]|uniref:Mediator complex subunit Med12 domain-containing protein n=1 Tax=Castilleja foliolosa TaxID=1961234 RepID=A0ABD3BXX3_9LAMI